MKRILIIAVLLIVFQLLISKVSAESFTWPSEGYLGWRFYQNTNGQEGISGTYHTGIDIWSNTNGGWNGGVTGSSNPIYSAYSGKVVYVDYLGLQIKHRDGLYTNYWHVKDRKVSTGNNVGTNTLLGYQDYANAVHVHVTVSTQPLGHDATGATDPTPYFGVQLDVRQSGVKPWGYHVTRQNQTPPTCNIPDIQISRDVFGNLDCPGIGSIDIIPESHLVGEQHYHII